ncbi:MAG: hypothetical protein ACKE51_08485 [Methylococcaceae bacterium]
MKTEKKIELLGILVENSARILRAGFGVNYAESTFFSIIDLLRNDSNLKSNFLSRVETALNQPDPGLLNEGIIPQELIELVAHEMRWNEIKVLAEKRVQTFFHGNWSFAISDISQKIIDARSDSWPDQDFYICYQKARE